MPFPPVDFPYTYRAHGKIYDSVLDTIGGTPLVRLNRIPQEHNLRADILAKLEFFNPLNSVKERLAYALVADAETRGEINKETVLIEPTSGNTGIALAFVAAVRGYRVILVMPESMSIERRKMLTHLGAELELTPAAGGMRAAVARAEEMAATIPHAKMLQQFVNPANLAIHRVTMAEEIWEDTSGNVDVVIAGVGTGGTICGIAQVLKRYKPEVKIIAVEPADSPVLSGGSPGPHKIQGIGAGFIPQIVDTGLFDEVMPVKNDDAFATSRLLAKKEGIAAGISSGAAIWAALQVGARHEMAGKRIVAILASCAERYMSTDLFEK